MIKKIGIKEVAEASGVSIGTVSKILNPMQTSNIRVSDKTKKLVLDAAKNLNYHPSYGAKLLRGESTKTIGFATSLPYEHDNNILTSYTSRILNGILAEATKNKYQVLLIQGEDYSHFIDTNRIDGLIITGFRLDNNPVLDEMMDMFRNLNDKNYPYVIINGENFEGLETSNICVDNDSGMKQIAELIIEKKFATVGFLGELSRNAQRHHVERAESLKKYLKNSDVKFDSDNILNGVLPGHCESSREGLFSFNDGRDGFCYMLENGRLPRCIICGNDDIALGVIQAAKEHNIAIPDELAIVGFDDSYCNIPLSFPLSTVCQDLETFGRLAVDFIIEKRNARSKKIDLTIKPKLIRRDTF